MLGKGHQLTLGRRLGAAFARGELENSRREFFSRVALREICQLYMQNGESILRGEIRGEVVVKEMSSGFFGNVALKMTFFRGAMGPS